MSLNYIVLLLLNAHNQVLLARRINTPFCNGYYALPSCSINRGQTATQAALQEAHRTLGLTLAVDDLVCTLVMHRKCNEAEFFMTVFQLSHIPPDTENHDLERYDDMQWFQLDALPDMMVAAHRYAVQCVQEGLTYAEHGWKDHCLTSTKS